MPENPSDLHVVGRTADGQLWHTIRSPGGWTPFVDVLEAANLLALRGHVVDVACTRRMGVPGVVDGLYVLAAFDNEPPRLLFRVSNGEPKNAGMWSQKPGAFFPTARKVTAGAFTSIADSPAGKRFDEIHLAVVTDDGHLLSAFAEVTATEPVQQPDDVELTAGETGELRAVALDTASALGSPSSSLRLLAVTADARLLQTVGHGAGIGDPNGQWTAWLEVAAGPGGLVVPADPVDADLAARSVVAATGDGHVWLAPAIPGLGLGAWVDLETYTYTVSGAVWSGTFTGVANVGTFNTVAGAWANEGLHIVGTTTNGRLWHQLRGLSMAFGDIELAGVGQNVGDFTAAGCG
jgi:hypothetical protein